MCIRDRCCNPLPGDEIVGFITRGHGISVHTTGCTNYIAALKRDDEEELARWMDVQWTDSEQASLQTSIEVIALDRVGLVYDITAILTEARIPIPVSYTHLGECYNVLGLVHDMYRPIPNRFKDYISTPKANMYPVSYTHLMPRLSKKVPYDGAD